MTVRLAPHQLDLIQRPPRQKLFLEGPAGAGKTTAGVEWVLRLMQQGLRGDSILLLTPQRTLAGPYFDALRHPGVTAGGMVTATTIGGLAQRLLEVFWPLAAPEAGFAHPSRPPVFLTLETAQYFMARLVAPLLDQGFFDGVSVQRSRLYSQVIDNLNKAAAVGFPHTEIGERLQAAWIGESRQRRVYADVQTCASLFRQHCLEHNLLDFSLQLETFLRHLWPLPICQDYLYSTYRHLVADNLEEDIPAAHDLVEAWLPELDSALLIYDCDAGYRSFLGADPDSAHRLAQACNGVVEFPSSFTVSPAMQTFSQLLGMALARPTGAARPAERLEPLLPPSSARTHPSPANPARGVLLHEEHRFYPQMLDWVSRQIACLVHEEGVPPGEIAVLAPFLSDALRFALTGRLEHLGVAVRSHRPSRALREEPAAQCLVTLTLLAHPHWCAGLAEPPSRFDVAYALIQAVAGLDLVRAQLLVDAVYSLNERRPHLASFDEITPAVQERVTFSLGRRCRQLFDWLADYAAGPEVEVDYFFSRLFGEVLSQPGFGFHASFNDGEIAANLVESARKFRYALAGIPLPEGRSLGEEYICMVQDGVVAAQYILSWRSQPEDAVLLAPAYTFLMANRPVEIQFWLDIASRSWFERLDQPLTHPYVLSRRWPQGSPWTDEDEYAASRQALTRLAVGLTRRCRGRIYLGLSQMNEQGYEVQGPLLKAVSKVMRLESL
jgi:hypothetical protein